MHASPPFRILAIMAPFTAASISASSNIRKGALPPSSIEQSTIQSEASLKRLRPTSVDPVKDNFRTSGLCKSALTTSPERRDGTTFITPAGTPASARISAIRSAVKGVSDAGFRMTEQPAARAGAIFLVAIAAG